MIEMEESVQKYEGKHVEVRENGHQYSSVFAGNVLVSDSNIEQCK